MLFYTFLAIVLLLCVIWITFLVLYYLREIKIHTLYTQFLRLLQERNDSLPLLISLMTPYVVKKEEVFEKYLLLREKLRISHNLSTEKEISHQLEFLFQVVEKHEKLLQDKRFRKIQQDLQDIRKKTNEIVDTYNKEVLLFSALRKKSLFTLFPGYFLFPHTPHLDFHT